MIKVAELFSGIGAQAKALERLGIEHEIVATSDLDKDAIVSYAAIHNGLTLETIESYADYPSRQEMADYLSKLNIGYDFKKNKPFDWHKLTKGKKILHDCIRTLKKQVRINSVLVNVPKYKPIEMYYLAAIISKQVGDISSFEEILTDDGCPF